MGTIMSKYFDWCCCCNKQDEEDTIDINVNIKCTNSCCQKNVSDPETKEFIKQNILQRLESSIIRRCKQTSKGDETENGTSIELVKSTMDLQSPQTNKEKVSKKEIRQ